MKSEPWVGKEYGRVYAWDKINAPMIRQWREIMGVDPARYIAEGAVIVTSLPCCRSGAWRV